MYSGHIITTMLRRTPIVLLVCLNLALGQTTIPDSAAGRALRAWMNAFNGGDRATIEDYIKTVDPSQSVEAITSFRNQTGGFELLSVESSEPRHIRFRVKEKNGPTTAMGNLVLKAGEPSIVETFGLRALPPGVEPVNVVLDASLRQKVIDGVDKNLQEFYIDSAVAKRMQDAVQAHQRAGDYDSIADGDAFAAQLGKDLRAVSNDKHLGVAFSPFKMPERRAPSPEDVGRMGQQLRRSNCMFSKVEVLPSNVGYVKFDAFMTQAYARLPL